MRNAAALYVAHQAEALGRDFWFSIALAAALLVPFAHAQNCGECLPGTSPGTPGTASEWSFAKQVNEVNVLFLAARGSRFVEDLSPDDVTLRDDNKPPAAILAFRSEKDLPLRIALLVDTSDSLTERFRFEQAAASAFLRHSLSRSDDQGLVIGFSDRATLMQDFTHDPDLLAQAVERLRIEGGTALYDAIRASCLKLLRHSEREVVARVLVVLSDGQNNTGKLRLEDAVDIAQRSEVTVYTISTHSPRLPKELDSPSAIAGNRNLRRLAEQTGGRVLFPTNPKEIGESFEKITDELRSRYAISYRPAEFSNDGRYRRIVIQARKAGKKLHVRARKGYYARTTSPETAGSAESSNLVSTLPKKH